MKSRFIRGIPAPAAEIQVDWLSRLLHLLQALEKEGWVWSAVAVRALRALVSDDSWRRLKRHERTAVLVELQDLNGRLKAIADRRPITLEIRNASLVTRFSDGDPESQNWTQEFVQTSFTAYAVNYLTDAAVCRRCRRCGRLFAAARGRGRPPHYCPARCALMARTQRWRDAHRAEFRAQRRAAYKRRLERLHKRSVKIQLRRQLPPNGPKQRRR